jgi:AcrR family transcriptional regulator
MARQRTRASSDVRAHLEGDRLPRGRHNLSREDVLASQRRRIVAAMLDCTADKGYAATTVTDVVSAASVSRNAFYELFDDKQGCFLAACDEAWGALLGALYAQAREPTWIDALKKGMRVYLTWWQEQPWMSDAYLLELPAAGRRAQEQRDRTYRDFARMFEALAARAREEQPELPPLRALAPRILVGGITELVAEEVRAGRLDRLHELEDELTGYVIATLADEATARIAHT